MGHVLRGVPSGHWTAIREGGAPDAGGPGAAHAHRAAPVTDHHRGQTGQLFFRRYEPDQVQRVRWVTISASLRGIERTRCTRGTHPGAARSVARADQADRSTGATVWEWAFGRQGGDAHVGSPRGAQGCGCAFCRWALGRRVLFRGRCRAAHGRALGFLTRLLARVPAHRAGAGDGQQQGQGSDREQGAHGQQRRQQPSQLRLWCLRMSRFSVGSPGPSRHPRHEGLPPNGGWSDGGLSVGLSRWRSVFRLTRWVPVHCLRAWHRACGGTVVARGRGRAAAASAAASLAAP